eukprot:g5983.t1
MRLLIIRHAQSRNNELADRLFGDVRLGKINREEAFRKWLSEREADPELSKLGQRQADLLGTQLAPLLNEYHRKGHPIFLTCSAMYRAIQTLDSLFQKSSVTDRPLILPDIFECGGIFSGIEKNHSTNSTTFENIVSKFPHFEPIVKDTAGLKKFNIKTFRSSRKGQLFQTNGFESRSESKKRAHRIARWLRESDELHNDWLKGDPEGVLVCVMHADFIDLLLQALLFDSTSVTSSDDRGRFAHLFSFKNTATGMLSIVNPRMKNIVGSGVTVNWLGRIDHLINGKGYGYTRAFL